MTGKQLLHTALTKLLALMNALVLCSLNTGSLAYFHVEQECWFENSKFGNPGLQGLKAINYEKVNF